MLRIIVPIALLALALGAWYMENATKPASITTQTETISSTTAVSQPPPPTTSSGSEGIVVSEDSENREIPQELPQITGSTVTQLTDQLEASINSFPTGTKSCLVAREQNVISEQVVLGNLFEHNPQLSLVPASNQKLITAAAALLLLGPDYKFTTRVLAPQPPADGVIVGDLYLVGGGDPLLYTTDYVSTFARRPAVYTPVEELAQQVYDRGLRRVVGRIVGVESRYDSLREATPVVTNYFIGPLSALLLNDGYENYQQRRDLGAVPVPAEDPAQFSASLFDDLLENLGMVITARPRSATSNDDIGGYIELARIESAPLSELLTSLLTDSDNTSAELLVKEIATRRNYLEARSDATDQEVVDAESDSTESQTSNSGDALAFGALAPSSLRAAQTEVPPSPDEASTATTTQTSIPPGQAPPIIILPVPTTTSTTTTTTTTTTEPERVIPAIQDPDENPLETLPGSTELGLRYIGEILLENGIQSWVGMPRDGSGLDRGNLLNCTVLADVLDHFGPDSDFADALAIAGGSGTLQNSFLNTPLEQRLHAKTGSLSGVVALSGFINSNVGKTVTFVLLVNFNEDEVSAGSIRAIQEEILLALAGYLDASA